MCIDLFLCSQSALDIFSDMYFFNQCVLISGVVIYLSITDWNSIFGLKNSC